MPNATAPWPAPATNRVAMSFRAIVSSGQRLAHRISLGVERKRHYWKPRRANRRIDRMKLTELLLQLKDGQAAPFKADDFQ